MSRYYIPFFAFLALLTLLIAIPFTFDFATSVVPGWHTTVFPPYFIRGLIVLIALLFVTIGYWFLIKRPGRINWTLFAIHFVLTIPTIIYLKFPSILLDLQLTNQEEVIKWLEFRMKLISIAWTLFIAGQIMFFLYYIRAIKTKRAAS